MQKLLPKAGDKILWIRFSPLGDVVQSGAEAMLFKKRFPDTDLTFLTTTPYAELVAEQPWCDKVIIGNKRPWAEFKKTLAKIKGKYDWLISDNHGGHTAALSLFSKIPNTVGTFSMQFMYGESLEKFFARAGIANKDRKEPSFFAEKEDIEYAKAVLSKLPDKKLFAIIGASKEERMWPEENWRELLKSLLDEGWGVVLSGNGKREKTVADKLETILNNPNVFNSVSKFSLKQLLGVVSNCNVAVGNDTGTLHLAALSGIPTIGLSDCNQFEWLGLCTPWFIGLCADKTPTKEIHSSHGHSREKLASITAEEVKEQIEQLCR